MDRSDEDLSRFVLPSCLHGLRTEAYWEYMSAYHSSELPRNKNTPSAGLSQSTPSLALTDGQVVHTPAFEQHSVYASDSVGQTARASPVIAPTAPVSATTEPSPLPGDLAYWNFTQRAGAMGFFQSIPTVRVLMLATRASPFLPFNVSDLQRSSESCPTRQWCKHIPDDMSGVQALLGNRGWPLL